MKHEDILSTIKEFKDSVYIYHALLCVGLFYTIHVISDTDLSHKRAVTELFIVWIVISFICIGFIKSRKFPKFKPGTNNILLAVQVFDKADQSIIEKYFFSEIRKRFSETQNGKLNVYIMSSYQTNKFFKMKSEKKKKVFEKTGAYLIFEGDGKTSNYMQSEVYALHLSSKLNMEKCNPSLKGVLVREISQVSKDLDKIYIPANDNVRHFNNLTLSVKLVADYMFGFGLLCTPGKIGGAESVFSALNTEVSRISQNIPSVAMLKHIVPMRLALTYVIMAENSFNEYRKTKDFGCLDKMEGFLQKQEELGFCGEAFYTDKAILLFCRGRDVKNAKACIQECQRNKFQGYPWRFSKVFLNVYRCKSNSKLANAYRSYKSILKNNPNWYTEFQVEEFIVDIIETEPEQKQLYWLLSMLANARGDYSLSNKYLSFFTSWDEMTLDKEMQKMATGLEYYNKLETSFVK